MEKKELLYEGKAKKVYLTNEANKVLIEFKDDITAFDGAKKAVIEDKGKINAKITKAIFNMLEKVGVKTHFIKEISDREHLNYKLEIIPVEVVIRNIAAGSFSKRYGIKEGEVLEKPLYEFFLKNDELHDPMLCLPHILLFKLANEKEIEYMVKQAFKVNETLKEFFDKHGILLVDFKLEFGRYYLKEGEEKNFEGMPIFENEKGKYVILLGDEFTPDSCRLWKKETGEKLDKDVFRRDLGDVKEKYMKVYKIVVGEEK